jgi:hypothetical protein
LIRIIYYLSLHVERRERIRPRIATTIEPHSCPKLVLCSEILVVCYVAMQFVYQFITKYVKFL